MSQANVTVPPVDPAGAAPVAPPPPPPPAGAASLPPAPAPPAASPLPAGPPADPNAPVDPNWFKPRLDQAKRAGETSVLTALGAKDVAEAKANIDRARAAEEAEKTELQRAKDRVKELEATSARAIDNEAAVKAMADAQLSALTEEQRTIVADIIGDDPAKIVQKLPKLRASWASTTAPPAAAAAPPAAPPPAASPPANTSPPANAPGGAAPTSPPDRKAEYAALKVKNPHAAAAYLNAYSAEIYPRA